MIPLRVRLALVLVLALASKSLGNGWVALTNQPQASANTMLLLTDGRVLLNSTLSTKWFLLTPDASGSYVNGTWTRAADANYSRLYFASAVLADGRVIVAGGEYSSGGSETDKTEIYDPVADTWTVISPPTGWSSVGDAPASLLSDGTWLIGSISGSSTAIWDPVKGTWSAGPNKSNGTSSEESWTLLPDGSVLTCDCSGHPHSERYVPSLSSWVDCGNTPVDLVEASSIEIGPAIVMNDGRAFFMGATPHCALYTAPSSASAAGTWVQGNDPPQVGGQDVGAKDAPAALLPNGNVLCALGPVDGKAGDYLYPTYMFEFDGSSFIRAPDPANATGRPYVSRMLLVPTGEVFFAAGTIYVYTCDGGPSPAWKPTITSVTTDLVRGQDYPLSGTQLNGLSQACGYGDDAQMSTNYPLVRLTCEATNHVFYCRTYGHSTMAIATGSAVVSTNVHVPSIVETGAATLEVVANGIASDPVRVFVHDPDVINFDTLATGAQVTNQYASLATFSSDPGYANWTYALSEGNSLPNTIATGPSGGGIDGTHSTFVDFAIPVVALTFNGIGVDGTGPVASVNVFVRGAFAGSVPINGAGDPLTPVHVDLTSFKDVSRIEIGSITDSGGIAWDDFVFGIPSASWTNYGAGFAGTNGVPSLTSEQNPVLGGSVTLDLGNSRGATTPALFLTGLQQASIQTSKGGELLLVPLLYLPLSLPAGGAKLTGNLPNDPALTGLQIFCQALELDSGAAFGLSFTPGLELVLGY